MRLSITPVVLCGLLIACTGTIFSTAHAADDDETIEEIVVTGSYLRRSSEDSPSPLSIVTSADIDDQGIADVAELVANLPWQSGGQTRAATFGGGGNDGRNTINLRNLGNSSTLPLINGKRQAVSFFNERGNSSVNINALVPSIAIERVEVVKDGASSLYGSDAIAGVVNFITDNDFEGFDLNYQFTTDDETGLGDTNKVEAKFGFQGERGGMMVAASIINRDEITVGDRFDRFGGSTVSGTGQPGSFTPLSPTITFAANSPNAGQTVPVNVVNFPRFADGSSFGRADPNCEVAAIADGEGGTLGPTGAGVAPDNFFCQYDFGSFFAIQAEESIRTFFINGHYDLTESAEVYFEFANTGSEFDRANSLNPNAPTLTIPTTSFGLIDDADRRGILPIPLANATRLIGQTVDDPTRPIETFTDTSRNDQRIVVGTVWDFNLGDKEWRADASFTATEHDTASSQVQDTLSSQFELAINGLGGPECDPINGTPGEGNLAFAASGGNFDAGQCYFFNPFGSSRFARDGSPQTDLTLVNPVELIESLLGRITSDLEFRQRVAEIVVSGDLFSTKSGNAGLAVGFQRRRDTADAVFDAASNTNNLDFVFGASDWDGALTTTAVFAELNVPITDRLEVNLAGRFEDFDEINENSFDPKLSILYRPVDSLSLRGSVSTAFRVPSLQQLFGTLTTVANEADQVGGTAFRPSITNGNPQLQPEEATVFNVGFSWRPEGNFLEGFQIDADYYNYDYTDIITRESSNTLLGADNAAIEAFAIENGFTNPDGTANFSTGGPAAVAAGVGNRTQIVRNEQGVLLRLLPDFVNASSADVSGIDLTASYTFSTAIGNWRLGIAGAWVNEYEVDTGSTIINSVGVFTDTNPVARTLPEWKINGTVNWSYGNHRAFALIKFISELEADAVTGADVFAAAGIETVQGPEAAASFLSPEIPSVTTVDLQYTYSFGERGFLSDSEISLGLQNVFNTDPPITPSITGFDPTVHDPRGRIFFVRAGVSL